MEAKRRRAAARQSAVPPEGLDASSAQEGATSGGASGHDTEADTAMDFEAPAYGPNDPADQPGRTTIESIPDEDEIVRWFEKYPGCAGEILHASGDFETTFQRWRREDNTAGRSRWYPFENREEWELGCWLARNVGQNQLEEFLHIALVRTVTITLEMGSIDVDYRTDNRGHLDQETRHISYQQLQIRKANRRTACPDVLDLR